MILILIKHIVLGEGILLLISPEIIDININQHFACLMGNRMQIVIFPETPGTIRANQNISHVQELAY